jgi:transposase-like protein
MPKHVVYVYRKTNKKAEHRLKLHIDGKYDTKNQIYTLQQDGKNKLVNDKNKNVFQISLYNLICQII